MSAPAPVKAWPVFASLQGYQRVWVRADVIAGLTVWAVLVPEALAYATIAGVPPVVGLYAAIPSLVLYAAAGSSRHLVVGPMSATAALSAASVAHFAGGNSTLYVALTAALAIVTGVLGLLAGLLRLGFIASLISEPVLKGFIVGLALTIMIGQVPKFFGIEKTDGDFFQQAWGVITELGNTQWPTFLVGVLSLAVVGPAVGVLIVGFAEGPGAAKATRSRRATGSRRIASWSGWAPRTSGPGCAPAWWSTGACPRPPSTAGPARGHN